MEIKVYTCPACVLAASSINVHISAVTFKGGIYEMSIDVSNDIKLVVCEKDIKQLVQQLKKDEIDYFDVPEEYRSHSAIVKTERELGIRQPDKRGFDVIQNTFFVEEIILTKNILNKTVEHINNYFSDFISYYDFLSGDIYENACYFQYNFSQTEIESYDLDLNKIKTSSLIDITVNDFSIDLSGEELKQYNDLEKDKICRKKWIAKFNACTNYEDFDNMISQFTAFKLSEYGKSKGFDNYEVSQTLVSTCKKYYFAEEDLIFFFYNLVFSKNDKAFNIIMQYMSENGYLPYNIEKELCSIYGPEKVLEAYNYYIRGATSATKRQKKRLIEYTKLWANKQVTFCFCSYFDEKTHFFCHQSNIYIDNSPTAKIHRYFETFQELAEHLKYDLSNCDLSKAILPDVDFSVYKTDEHTKLPIQNPNDLTYSIYKGYDRKSGCFVVKQSWLDTNGNIIKEFKNTFNYFFDFLCFLDNDLSDADLLFCDGLDKLCDFSNINLTNARLRSGILDKIGCNYPLSTIDTADLESFPYVIKNEEETTLVLTSTREIYPTEETINNQKVYYVSDLHLLHRVQNASCKSREDDFYTIQRDIDCLLDEVSSLEKNIILIGGDTSSDFDLFNLFVQQLRQSIDEKFLDIQVIFLLGNHELWNFPNCSFEEIVQKYEMVLVAHKMYLLQNNILYKDDDNCIQKISTNDLLSISKENIREKLKSARIILFGGLAFSGFNDDFNACDGIYRFTIDRNQEIAESRAFENLYNTVTETLYDRNVIIFTHTPQKDWCSQNNQLSGFVYVSGHTHRNYFYDDGDYRVYADNQMGYKRGNAHFKYFYLEDEYDWFSEYDDGIHVITKKQYINFYHGKNIMMQFTRNIYILYMLKKNGYYCFIHQSKRNQLSILNGGALKRLAIKDINYYYDRMDATIVRIENPLNKFTSIQKQLAAEVVSIGGSGNIHGAIIDIDYYNHIYVNPYDLTITGYWASDIINKKVYSNIPKLLKAKCPLLHDNYTKLLKDKTKNVIALSGDKKHEPSTLPHTYLDTDIYKASREIKKMQKLSSNILSVWYEPGFQLLE